MSIGALAELCRLRALVHQSEMFRVVRTPKLETGMVYYSKAVVFYGCHQQEVPSWNCYYYCCFPLCIRAQPQFMDSVWT